MAKTTVQPKRTSLEQDIDQAEKEVIQAKKNLAQLRRKLPAQEVQDYILVGPGGERVSLSSAFGQHDDLIVIHNMGRGCAYCTLWADGFNGVVQHLENRTAFMLVSPDPPDVQSEFSQERGWKFRMLSGQESTFTRDMGFQADDGGYRPGVSAFHKERDGRIYRVSKAGFGPGDDFCNLWHLFDLLPQGPGDWQPKFKY